MLTYDKTIFNKNLSHLCIDNNQRELNRTTYETGDLHLLALVCKDMEPIIDSYNYILHMKLTKALGLENTIGVFSSI